MKKIIDTGDAFLFVIFMLLCVLISECKAEAKNNYAESSMYLCMSLNRFSDIKDQDIRQETLKYIINFYIQHNRFSEAMDLENQIISADDKVQIYSDIAIQLHLNHDEVEARKYLKYAQDISTASLPSIETISEKLKKHLNTNDKRNHEVISQAQSWAFSRNSRANYLLAKTHAILGNIQEALEIIALMRQDSSEEQWDDFASISVVSRQVTQSGLSEALKTTQAISANDLRDRAYLEIIKQLISSEQIDKVDQILNEIKSTYKREQAISSLSVYYFAQGKNSWTEEYLNRISTKEGKLYVYSALAAISKEVGNLELGKEYLKKAIEINNGHIFEERKDVEALKKELLSVKEPNEGLKILEEISGLLESRALDSKKSELYLEFIQSLLVYDLAEEAYKNALKLSNPNYKDDALIEISLYYVKTEKDSSALECLRHLSNDYKLRDAYYSIGKLICDLKIWDRIDFWHKTAICRGNECLLYLGIANALEVN